MATRLFLIVLFAAIASAEIQSWVKASNKDPSTTTDPASARRATVTNTQYAINGVYPGSDSFQLATRNSDNINYTTTLASSAYGGVGSGVSMTVDTSTAALKLTSSGSWPVPDCITSVSSRQDQTFVGSCVYTTSNTAPTSCADLTQIQYGDTLVDTTKSAVMIAYGLIRTSSTTLGTYVKTSDGTVVSLTMGAGQDTGDVIISIETSDCGGGQTFRAITVLSTVTMSGSADWDAAEAQSIITPTDFTLNCNTVPMIAIVGLEGTAARMVCSGCASNPATKVQASIMSILLLGLLVIGVGRL